MTRRRLVCVLGPPAAGKTTLATRLAADFGALILRPRDVIRETLAHCLAVGGLFFTDTAGRVADESLGLALRVAIEMKHGTAILENLPWTAPQLCDLARLAPDSLTILHLYAADDLVTERRRARRYCSTCYPRPAQITGTDKCRRCGTVLTRRDDDKAVVFAERLALHHELIRDILDLAPKLYVPVIRLDAGRDLERIAWEARLSVEAVWGIQPAGLACHRPATA
jgi:adenylate kinase family enzyme